jgi:hypothetical protein
VFQTTPARLPKITRLSTGTAMKLISDTAGHSLAPAM